MFMQELPGLNCRIDAYVAHIQLTRTSTLNTFTFDDFAHLAACFDHISANTDVRCVILSALPDSKAFTAGLDLKETSAFPQKSDDAARQGLGFLNAVTILQQNITSIEKCSKPVVACVSGICFGAGIDIITACDIRLCSRDAVFSVKEVDIGICADLGTLQRLPKICGNQSWVKDVSLTARSFGADEALQFGLVSRVLDTRQSLIGTNSIT